MSENSKIAWCDSTFNPWIGCTKVSQGCKNCYAETQNNLRNWTDGWGPQGTRKRTSDNNWRKPLTWNNNGYMECVDCGWRGEVKAATMPFFGCPECGGPAKPARRRVFCASLADVFEENKQLIQWRRELFSLIKETPNLDWLLLTKRPENIISMTIWNAPGCRMSDNVWIGTSVENQEAADKRIPELLKVPAAIHFLSVEPMLGPIDLQLEGRNYGRDFATWSERVQWVIVGGESGAGHRPVKIEWIEGIVDQCIQAGVPVFVKQDSGMYPGRQGRIPDELFIHEFPTIRDTSGE